MAYRIIAAECVSCDACVAVCPNGAIGVKRGTYVIDPAKCTECCKRTDGPQCASVCPTDCCQPA